MKLKLTHDEVRILVFALNELRNTLIAENKYTDAVDELLLKFCKYKCAYDNLKLSKMVIVL